MTPHQVEVLDALQAFELSAVPAAFLAVLRAAGPDYHLTERQAKRLGGIARRRIRGYEPKETCYGRMRSGSWEPRVIDGTAHLAAPRTRRVRFLVALFDIEALKKRTPPVKGTRIKNASARNASWSTGLTSRVPSTSSSSASAAEVAPASRRPLSMAGAGNFSTPGEA